MFPWGDPVNVLDFEDDLHSIQRENADGGFFEKAIQHYFLDNPHRLLLTLSPDPDMDENKEKALKRELKAIYKSMSPKKLEKINRNAQILEKRQEEPENISCLPTLRRKDIPLDVDAVAASFDHEAIDAQFYDQPTSGIVYVRAVADIRNLSPDLLPMVPFFCFAFNKMGTRKRDYTQMAGRISRYTGGVGLSAQARIRFGTRETLPQVILGGNVWIATRKCFGIFWEN